MPSLFMGLLFFVAAFVVSVLIVPVMIRVASYKGWVDQPGNRKIHEKPVPRLGGVAIYLATWAAWGLFASFYPNVIPFESVRPFWALFIGSTLIWFLGIYDDICGANAWKKLSVQVLAALIVVSQGFNISLLYNPLAQGDWVLDSALYSWPLTIFWIVGVTNAINLIDGLDGLAGGVCMITALTLYFISKGLGIPHLPYFSLCIAGACLGFLIFNFSPAKIFLGDSGSLFLGFVLACISILGTVKRSTAIVMFGPPLILALPVMDTLLAILRRFFKSPEKDREAYRERWRLGFIFKRLREIFEADQGHIHHGLLKIGLSHRMAVIILYFVTAILGATAYQTAVEEHLLSTVIVFCVLSLALAWLMRKVKHINQEAKPTVSLSRPQELD